MKVLLELTLEDDPGWSVMPGHLLERALTDAIGRQGFTVLSLGGYGYDVVVRESRIHRLPDYGPPPVGHVYNLPEERP